jgi:hypothetical protein
MPMIDSDKLAKTLESHAACQAAIHAIMAEWRELPSEQRNARSDEYTKRLDVAEKPYFLACERVVYELNQAISAAKAVQVAT